MSAASATKANTSKAAEPVAAAAPTDSKTASATTTGSGGASGGSGAAAATTTTTTTAKTVLVTGPTGSIGKEIALGLAKKKYAVYLGVRNKDKGIALATEITKATGNAQVYVEVFDQSDKKSVSGWAAEFRTRVPRLNVLVNNAAVVSTTRAVTTAGLELQFATNVLGYYWLMIELQPILKAAAAAAGSYSRIVNVASNYAGGLNLSDPQFAKPNSYDPNLAYRSNKQANRMLSWYAADLWSGDSITVNACHPGVVESKLLNDLGFEPYHSAAEGAATPIFLADNKMVEGKTGHYYASSQKQGCTWQKDKNQLKLLWDYCAKI